MYTSESFLKRCITSKVIVRMVGNDHVRVEQEAKVATQHSHPEADEALALNARCVFPHRDILRDEHESFRPRVHLHWSVLSDCLASCRPKLQPLLWLPEVFIAACKTRT